MLTAFIALGIFGTILVFLQGCAAVHRMMAPRGTDRAVERIQKWSAPAVATQSEIVRKESSQRHSLAERPLDEGSSIPSPPLLHRQADCRVPLGIFVWLTLVLALVRDCFQHFDASVPSFLPYCLQRTGGSLPAGYLYWLKSQRMAMFARQLPEALELVSRSLRAGHAFSVGLKLVGEEASDPIGTEFRRVFDEVSMGVAFPEALQNITDRLDCVDLRFFVTSVLVQRETGGNLAEIIDSLAGLIRMRFELQLKIKALSAEGRFSAAVLFALPLVIARWPVQDESGLYDDVVHRPYGTEYGHGWKFSHGDRSYSS